MEAEEGSMVIFENQPSSSGGALKEIPKEQQILERLRQIKLPASKTFDPQSLAAGTLYGTTQTLVMAIFPNPAKGPVTLRLSENGNYEVTLSDMRGSTVATYHFKDTQEIKLWPHLPNGPYLIKVTHGRKAAIGRLNLLN